LIDFAIIFFCLHFFSQPFSSFSPSLYLPPFMFFFFYRCPSFKSLLFVPHFASFYNLYICTTVHTDICKLYSFTACEGYVRRTNWLYLLRCSFL
jgi:hypothetical protein